jgi:hypothetical protein
MKRRCNKNRETEAKVAKVFTRKNVELVGVSKIKEGMYIRMDDQSVVTVSTIGVDDRVAGGATA